MFWNIRWSPQSMFCAKEFATALSQATNSHITLSWVQTLLANEIDFDARPMLPGGRVKMIDICQYWPSNTKRKWFGLCKGNCNKNRKKDSIRRKLGRNWGTNRYLIRVSATDVVLGCIRQLISERYEWMFNVKLKCCCQRKIHSDHSELKQVAELTPYAHYVKLLAKPVGWAFEPWTLVVSTLS
jgi:hypothetical protein